jgi:hypothetical protein
MQLYCSQPGSVNNEMVTVTAVTSTTFTATFGSSKTANWIVKPLIAYRSIIDYFYNDVGFTVSKLAVSEINPSLPSVSLEPGSINKGLDKIRTLSYAAQRISTTVGTGIAAGNRTVTPQDMTNIQVGSQVWCADADGLTNREYVSVTATTFTTFTAAFQLPKTSGWDVSSPAAPLYYWGFFQDDTFTPQLMWFDLFDPTRRTAYELSDTLVIDPATQVRYSEYTRNIDGQRRINAQTVIGANGAIGYYVDTAAVTAIGRVIEGEPILDTSIFTNQGCIDKATAFVQNFKFAKEVVTVGTKSQIAPNIFYEAHTARWGNQAEGGTPATYNVAHRHLEFSTGNPKYLFEIGDRYEELNDQPQPAYGASTTHDFEAPSTPTWVGGSYEWVLSNVYNPTSGQSELRVQCALGAEFDLLRVGFRYRVAGRGFSALQFVTVNGGADSAIFDCPPVPPNTLIDFEASAYDRSGNFSPPSSLATVTSAAVSLPLAPTITTVSPNVYNPITFRTDVTINFTASVSPGVDHYVAIVQDLHLHYISDITGTSFQVTGLDPGTSCSVVMIAVDVRGVRGLPTASFPFTTASTVVPNPPTGLAQSSVYDYFRGISRVTVTYTLSTTPIAQIDHYQPYVVISGITYPLSPVDRSTASFSFAFTPSSSISVYIVTIDIYGQPSAASTTLGPFSVAAAVGPPAPTMTGEPAGGNYWNPQTQLTDVFENFTQPSPPSGQVIVRYLAHVTPAGGYTRYYSIDSTSSPAPFPGLDPGVLCDAYLAGVDQWGTPGSYSALRQFTTAAEPVAAQVPNGDFQYKVFDVTGASTAPASWAVSGTVGQANIDTSDSFIGINSLKLTPTVLNNAEVTSKKTRITFGKNYNLRIFIKSNNATPANFYVKGQWYDKAGATIGSPATIVAARTVPTSWTDASIKISPPTNATSIALLIGTNLGVAYTVWVDGVAVVQQAETLDVRDANVTLSKLAARGTTFPVSPSVNDEFYRTDLETWCYWDGTNWLGDMMVVTMHNYNNAPPWSSTTEALACSLPTDYAWKVTRWNVSYYVGGTNDGSNYWIFHLRKLDNTISVLDIRTLDTHLDPPNNWLSQAATASFSNQPVTSDLWMQLYVETVGAPGALNLTNLVTVRRVMA